MTTKPKTVHVVTNAAGNHAAFTKFKAAEQARDRLNLHTHFSTPFVVVEMPLDPSDDEEPGQAAGQPPEA